MVVLKKAAEEHPIAALFICASAVVMITEAIMAGVVTIKKNAK